jgi:hypothetical protein
MFAWKHAETRENFEPITRVMSFWNFWNMTSSCLILNITKNILKIQKQLPFGQKMANYRQLFL